MQDKNNRPWLTRSGMEIPTDSLKKICRKWERETWERYLRWFEYNCTEAIVHPTQYRVLNENLREPALQQLGSSADDETFQLCDVLLATLPDEEAKVLRSVFLDGLTERETAATHSIRKSTVHDKKNRALERLKKISSNFNDPGTKYIMRGENSEIELPPTIWDEPAKAKIQFLRDAIFALPRRQNRAAYLRFWCDQPIYRIARDLVCGGNVAQDICDIAAAAIKREVLQQIFKPTNDGGPTCA